MTGFCITVYFSIMFLICFKLFYSYMYLCVLYAFIFCYSQSDGSIASGNAEDDLEEAEHHEEA